MSAPSIAASASAARRSGRARPALSPEALDAALAYIARAAGNLGGHRHRRRSAGAVAAPPARGGGALAAIEHVKVLRWHTRVPAVDAGADHAGAGRGADSVGQDRLCGAPRQPSARADAGGARRLRPAHRRRHRRWSARPCCCKGVNDDVETLARADARFRRDPRQALLPAPWRPRPRHLASAHDASRRAGR